MTVDEALAWIAELFEESADNISLETQREDMDAWDSLGTLTLMARLDEDFEILLEEGEVLELRQVSDIVSVLQKHGRVE